MVLYTWNMFVLRILGLWTLQNKARTQKTNTKVIWVPGIGGLYETWMFWPFWVGFPYETTNLNTIWGDLRWGRVFNLHLANIYGINVWEVKSSTRSFLVWWKKHEFIDGKVGGLVVPRWGWWFLARPSWQTEGLGWAQVVCGRYNLIRLMIYWWYLVAIPEPSIKT